MDRAQRTLCTLGLCVALCGFVLGCRAISNDDAIETQPPDIGATDTAASDSEVADTFDPDDREIGVPESPTPRLPVVRTPVLEPDCEIGSSWEHGAAMGFLPYVHAADDFIIGRVDRIEPFFFPFWPDHRGEIPREACEMEMVQPGFDLILSDVWSARGSLETNITIRISGSTWSKWGTYPSVADEPGATISWSYEPGLEVPPIVPGMQIGGAVYRHDDVSSLWFNTTSEPLFEVVGEELVIQRGPGRIMTCAPVDYLYLDDDVVRDAWDGLSVEAWRTSVTQTLAGLVSENEVAEARAWALNPFGAPGYEVYPIHVQARCLQRTIGDYDWLCDDGRQPFMCPNIDDTECACECSSDCHEPGHVCAPDNNCAAP